MDNVFTKTMADSAKKGPPFSPLLVPLMRKGPWAIPIQSHERAAKFRRDIADRKNAKERAQKVRLRAWILYILRFIFTGDICNAWANFGVFSAKFCMISAVLHLAAAEAAPFAIARDAEFRGRARRLARIRDTQADCAKMISEENEDVKRYLKADLGKGKPPAKADPPRKGRKNTGFKGNGDKTNKPNWIQTPPVVKGKGSKKGK